MQYRTNTQTRRGARGGFPEHDDFEGMIEPRTTAIYANLIN